MSAIEHVPPGHAPGRQTRRGRRGFVFAMVGFVVLGAASAIAVPVVAVLGATGSIKGGAAGGGGGVLAFAALLFLGFAWYIWRKGRGRPAKHVRLEVQSTELRRGDQVRARISIDPAPDAPRQVEVGLVCTVFYDVRRSKNEFVPDQTGGRFRQRDYRAVEDAEVHKEWHRRTTDGQEVSFGIPRTAPYSYEGDCVSVAWRITAREGGRRGFAPTRDKPIWVAP